MDYISGVWTNVSKFASHINPATLSGAIDIVFVKQKDGLYKSTPFYVKFGKAGVIRAAENLIYIEVNGKEIEQRMTLSESGVAFFEKQQQIYANTKSQLNRSSSRLRHKSEPSDNSNIELDTLQVLSAASRALSNPRLEEECDIQLDQSDAFNELTLTPEEMQQFNLHEGLNEAAFSVTTQFQGTTRCCCSIYVWDQTAKVIISDIDGTITKSDVRGMILPLIGVHDWAQEEVTQLYSKICDNGYKILYLSARSIGQAGATREYLRGLQQGSLKLPHGPLFLNPESVFKAFKKEVIDKKPEEFKKSCLEKLQNLFHCETPFFAGYGNRPNDVVAYEHVGIPKSRIFIINKSGELQRTINQTRKTSFKDQSCIVDLFFPPVNQNSGTDPNYWRFPIEELESIPMDL